ncbi:OprO/OprP family phosphate-selective porin [Limnoglobus roseus]|uniref:OprO/OprP family phosphate-selective porin n=1 Tax=Limnoglobus roseus TaxID=2598579 RepID=UPI00143D03A7|nr:porin [Limnoglobus roseus]
MGRTLPLLAIILTWAATPIGAQDALPAGAQDAPPADIAPVDLRADAVPPPEKAPEKPPDPLAMKMKWKNGPYFYTEDGLFTFQPGGRFQLDTIATAVPAGLRRNITGPSQFEDGVSVRRARFAADGTFAKTIDFKAEFDFANAFITQTTPQRASLATVPTELNLTFRQLPIIGNLRIGNQKQPISFEHMTSSKYLNFLERSTSFDAFAEGFNNGFVPGIQAFDNFLTDKRAYWALGVFKTTRSIFGFNVGRNEADLTGRLAYLPIYENKGEQLLHVGLGGSYRDLDDDQQRYRSRFSLRSSPSALSDLIADTGFLYGGREARLVPELAGVAGSFSFQAEYYTSWLSRTQMPVGSTLVPYGTTFYHGGYVEVHYFLTGEHREYDHERMAFTRVVPKNPIRWVGDTRGLGAWQLAARYGYLDLNDKGIVGGITHEFVLGLNWFLTPNAKLQANYVLTSREAADPAASGLLHGFGVRTAWDF